MNIFNVTSTINPENLHHDKAVVTLGIDSGVHPVLELRPKWRVESTLCYHFLAKKNVPEYLVVNAAFLPYPGDHYVFDTFEFFGQTASKIKIGAKTPIEGNAEYDYWRVDISYETLAPEPDGTSLNPNGMPSPSPYDPILDISRTTRSIEVPAWYDYNDRSVTNSARQLFNPPIMREVLIETFNITRREYINPNAKIDEYMRCVNLSSIWGGKFQPWQVLVEGINAPLTRIEGSFARHWDVTYSLSINKEPFGWKTAVLDMGTVEKGNSISEKPKAITEGGTPVSSPVMLNGSGKKLDTDTPGWSPKFEWTNGSPFEFRYKKDLNLLALPNPYA